MRLFSRAQIKAVDADQLHRRSRKDGLTYVSILCYYFIDRTEPIMPAVGRFRRTYVKVTLFPGQAVLPGFSNHMLALRLPIKCDGLHASELLACLGVVESIVGTYPMLMIGGVFIKGHLVHIDHLTNFLDRLHEQVRYVDALSSVLSIMYYYTHCMLRSTCIRLQMCTRFSLSSSYWAYSSV